MISNLDNETKVDQSISVQEVPPEFFVSHCGEVHPRMRAQLTKYLAKLVGEGTGVCFSAFDITGDYAGRVEVEIHEGYKTRGVPCATFGWLDGFSQEIITSLLEEAKDWARNQSIEIESRTTRNTLLRGPISFPKPIGGIGCQTKGFSLPRMYGESTNRRGLAKWITEAGFKMDAAYATLDVSNTPNWDSAKEGNTLGVYKLVNFTKDEWEKRKEEISNLSNNAFATFLPDTVSGRFYECLATLEDQPTSEYYWPAALNKEGNLVGFIICLPNLWENWDSMPITSVNVDTVVISPTCRGQGLFSTLHDKGAYDQQKYCHIIHWEGTSVWEANDGAVASIFPHGTICRRHVVFQKRLSKGKL